MKLKNTLKSMAITALLLLTASIMWASPQSEQTVNESNKLVIWSFTDELKRPIEHFKEMYPGVEVELTVVGNPDYITKLKPVLKSGKNAPDVFTGEAAYVKDLVENGYWDTLNEAPYSINTDDMFPYVVKIGTDSKNKVKALSWQTTPGGFFYRRSMAKKYFGTDDPDVMAKKFASMEAMIATARELKAKSNGTIKLLPGIPDLQWIALSQRTNPWVNSQNELIIDEAIIDYFKISKTLRDEGLDAKLTQWTPGWFEGMKSESEIFAYILPTWGLHYVLKENAPDTSGDWALTSGPAQFFWGGTWLGIYKKSQNKELAWKFVEMMSLNAESMKWWANETGDFLGNKKIVEEIKDDFSDPYLNGQNHYEYFYRLAEKIDGSLLTKYDQTINGFMINAMNEYLDGGTNLEEALTRIKDEVKSAYPHLKVN